MILGQHVTHHMGCQWDSTEFECKLLVCDFESRVNYYITLLMVILNNL